MASVCWEGHHACADCGYVQVAAIFEASYEELEQQQPAGSNYKRVHHFHERISQLFVLDSRVPLVDWVRILEALLQANVRTLSKGTIAAALRSVGKQKYLENWVQIISRLADVPAPKLSGDELRTLDRMFEACQVPFALYKPAGRTNFLNYNFVFHRFLQLMGRREVLCFFPLIKSRQKLQALNEVWAKICAYHGWELMPLAHVRPYEVPAPSQAQLDRALAQARLRLAVEPDADSRTRKRRKLTSSRPSWARNRRP